jgi:hypothetical protein
MTGGMDMISKLGKVAALTLATLLVWAGSALADQVHNDISADPKVATIAAGGSVNVKFWITSGGSDTQSGCNASDGSPAQVTINAPAAVTANPDTFNLNNCGSASSNFQTVGFSSSTPGTYAITVSVTDIGGGTYGTTPASFTLQVNGSADNTDPTITITTPPNGATYFLNQVVYADYECQDEAGGSGLASCVGTVADGAAIDTSSVGSKSFTVDAEDNAGNQNSLTHNYSVIFNWTGFFRPVDNPSTMNVVRAGSAVPVKFSLSGDQGLSIFATGFPASRKITCDPVAELDTLEETVTAGGSSLSYDSSIDQYNYVWKTDKAWAGTCRQLEVKLIDGTSHLANFKLTK